MRRRLAAIVNPVSGRYNMMPTVRKIGGEIKRAGGHLDVRTTEGLGHATTLAAELSAESDAILVVGGDGTVCEVVNGLIENPIPMAILRTGTENLLARELMMPSEPRSVAGTLLYGTAHALDVGVINNRRFLAVAGAGFDAECALRMSRARKGHITHVDYFWPVWRALWSHRFPELKVELDGQLVFEGRGFAILGIIGQYSLGMRILNRARYDDGLLDICVFPCTNRRQLAAHTFRVLLHRHTVGHRTLYHQGKNIRITSDTSVPLQVDGDAGGELPATCSIIPSAVQFLRHAKPSAESVE